MNSDRLQSLQNILVKLGIGGTALFAGGLVTLYSVQNKLIYVPSAPGLERLSEKNPKGYRSPQERNLNFEDVEIQAEDGILLKGWFLKQKESQTQPIVVFFHENAGNIGTRLDYLEEYYLRVACNVLIVAYRGYSSSEGSPSESGIQKDVKAILDHIFKRSDIDLNKIFTHGRSLGGATSLYGLTEFDYKIRGCVLENTFASIDEMSKIILPKPFTAFNKIVLKNKWDSLSRIGNLKIPCLVIRSLQDQIVPDSQMQQLQQKLPENKLNDQLVIENGDHNSNWTKDVGKYFSTVSKFIQNILKEDQK